MSLHKLRNNKPTKQTLNIKEEVKKESNFLSLKTLNVGEQVSFRIIQLEDEKLPMMFEGYQLQGYQFFTAPKNSAMEEQFNNKITALKETFGDDIPKSKWASAFKYSHKTEYVIRALITTKPDHFNCETMTFIKLFQGKDVKAETNLMQCISETFNDNEEYNLTNFSDELTNIDFTITKTDDKTFEFGVAEGDNFEDETLDEIEEEMVFFKDLFPKASNDDFNSFLGV